MSRYFLFQVMGSSEACTELMIREIMRVDNVTYENATKTMQTMQEMSIIFLSSSFCVCPTHFLCKRVSLRLSDLLSQCN